MKKLLLPLALLLSASARMPLPPTPLQLQGKWEVVKYSEQGVQVDKKLDALAQAVKVYNYVQDERARTWFGYDQDYADEYSRRKLNEYRRWEERDSTIEVARVAEAIATPYYAVFFADSTLSLYNKDAQGRISFPEVRRYTYSPSTMSIDIYPQGYVPRPQSEWTSRMEAQILSLTETQMTIFLPEDAEIVELVKADYVLP